MDDKLLDTKKRNETAINLLNDLNPKNHFEYNDYLILIKSLFDINTLLKLVKQQQAETERLKEKDRWIPVSEKLPEDKQLCLCAAKGYIFGYKVDVLTFYKTFNSQFNKFWDYDREEGEYSVDTVTHWRSLPEKPTE